jgi:hypothetical protein
VSAALTGTPGERAADAVTGGGAQAVLRGAPVAARGALDDAIRHAVGTGLGTVMLVSGVVGLAAAAAVTLLLRERETATAPEPADGSEAVA